MNTTSSAVLPTKGYMTGSHWIADHYADLTTRYSGHWVAVHENRVVAADPDLGVVESAARGIAPAADIAFAFIDDGSLIF